MKLLTKALIQNFPRLGETQNDKPEDIKIIAKFFTPWAGWTWYATEYDGVDRFFGYVKGLESEFGYFSLSELESIKGPAGLKVERDRFFGNKTLKEIMS
jgi:hypothetical protein